MTGFATKTHRFVVLDGLRGVAAVIVLIFHLVQQHSLNSLPFAFLAVDFFYMLSGFVVAFAYEQRLQYGKMRFAAFARVRLTRLYPLVFLSTSAGIALGFLAVYGKGDVMFHQIVLSGILGLLLLPSYVFPQWGSAYPFNMASWSLTFELFVNALYGIIASRLSLARLIALTIVSAFILAFVVLKNHGVSGGNDQDNFIFGFGRVMFPFFAGVLLFRVRFKQRPASMLGLILIITLAACLLMPGTNAGFVGFGYVVLLFPVMIAIGAAIEVGPVMTKLCLLGGEISYPIYILQGPLLRIGEEILKHLHFGRIGNWCFGTLEAAIVVFTAIIVNEIYDKPIQQYLKGRRPVQFVSSLPDGI